MSSPAHHYRDQRLGAVAFCRHQHEIGADVWHNLCQKATRTAYGAPPGEPSAQAAWDALAGTANRRHYDAAVPPPMGVPVYFSLNTPFGHVAVSAGGGAIWSTDILRYGCYDKVSIGYLERRWNARCVGWTTVINGVHCW